jgi:hypothetical protein
MRDRSLERNTLRWTTQRTFKEKAMFNRGIHFHWRYVWMLCVLSFLFASGSAYGQQDTGGILVVATDASGALIKDASVTIVNNGNNASFSGKTNEIGTWSASRRLPGRRRTVGV